MKKIVLVKTYLHPLNEKTPCPPSFHSHFFISNLPIFTHFQEYVLPVIRLIPHLEPEAAFLHIFTNKSWRCYATAKAVWNTPALCLSVRWVVLVCLQAYVQMLEKHWTKHCNANNALLYELSAWIPLLLMYVLAKLSTAFNLSLRRFSTHLATKAVLAPQWQSELLLVVTNERTTLFCAKIGFISAPGKCTIGQWWLGHCTWITEVLS